MARFLFVVPPFTGHINPTVAVGAELTRRGHEVAWTGVEGVTETLLGPGATFISAVAPEVAKYVASVGERRDEARGASAFKFLMEEVLLPLADHMVEGVDAAVERFSPDVLVADQQALAGAVVGRRRDMIWVTSATTSAELVDPLAAFPKVAEAMHQMRVELQLRHGIAPQIAAQGDLRLSKHLVVAYTVEELTGVLEGEAAKVPVAFVGPAVGDRPQSEPFAFERLSEHGPNVLVSLGTLNAEVGERFWGAASEAFARHPQWTGIFVAPDEMVANPPANVIVAQRIPQYEVLKHVHGVVSHAGHNTVCESLSQGLALVLAPIRDDQPVVADQVVRAGAGVRVKFARIRSEHLEEAIEQVLTNEELKANAQRIGTALNKAGGAVAAADALLGAIRRGERL